MEKYRNSSGKSGVNAFEVGNDFIVVQFTKGGTYLYNYAKTGSYHVDEMVKLARTGCGLNGYINSNVKYSYAQKMA